MIRRRDTGPAPGYNVVVVDPPWDYDNKQNGRAEAHYQTLTTRELAYLPCMTDGTVAADALLFVWVTTPFLHHLWRSDAPGFRNESLLDAWHARYVTSLYWHKAPSRDDVFAAGFEIGRERGRNDVTVFNPAPTLEQAAARAMPKTPLGTGYWFRGETEQLVVAVRGKFPALRSSRRNHYTRPPGRHSAKPELFQDVIEAAVAEAQARPKTALGPVRSLELFARRARPGWRCVGLETDGTDLRRPFEIL